MLVATPSGITLAPEGGAHQSIGTPLIGMAQDGLAAFEPAYVDELAVIMRLAFDYMQRDGEAGSPSALAAGRERRLGLSAPVDPAAWSSSRTMTAELRRGDHRRWLLAAPARARTAELAIVYTGRRGARGDRRRRPAGARTAAASACSR